MTLSTCEVKFVVKFVSKTIMCMSCNLNKKFVEITQFVIIGTNKIENKLALHYKKNLVFLSKYIDTRYLLLVSAL